MSNFFFNVYLRTRIRVPEVNLSMLGMRISCSAFSKAYLTTNIYPGQDLPHITLQISLRSVYPAWIMPLLKMYEFVVIVEKNYYFYTFGKSRKNSYLKENDEKAPICAHFFEILCELTGNV